MSTFFRDVLTEGWGLSSANQKIGNFGNGVRIHQYLHNQHRCRKTDNGIRFALSNRSNHPFARQSNCSFGLIDGKSKNRQIPGKVQIHRYLHDQRSYRQMDGGI